MLKEFFVSSPVIAWSIVSVMIALCVMVLLWDKIAWWWHNTWYSFPLIGRIARLSTDLNQDSSNHQWFKAERTLCLDYKKFIRVVDEHDFQQKITYLTKAGDNGRHDTPGWIWILTFAMVFVEAMGFAYVLAGYTLPGASENLQQTGAYGIAFLISVILVALTHLSGHELYKSSRIARARKEWVENGRQGPFQSAVIPLAADQSKDDNLPSYTQLANRVGTHASYMITVATGVFVLLVAVGATFVRGEVLEKQLHQTVTGQIKAIEAAPSDGLDMSKIALPEADKAQDQAADKKAIQDEVSIDRSGGWATFVILAFVFVFLQLLGVIFGFKWGFAGANSREAYRAIGRGRFATYGDVREHVASIADVAQAKLGTLQQRLMDRNAKHGNQGVHLTGNFYKFLDEERARQYASTEQNQVLVQQHAARMAAASVPAVATAPAVAQSPGVAEVPPGVTVQTSLEASTEALVAKLDAIGDKEQKLAFIAQQPPSVQEAIKNFLRARKDAQAAAAQAKLASEIGDLL
jgi:hypothetical protein